ncbi:ABC transporter substrate-binding protein [Pseudonocardia sp. CA-107938]|uniref:ABC transporter substrate-binding protein n=1 Tax=Pseudonocardia sp. CA-107938 TaxID=3240021 RepID=UPI003D93A50C
MRRTTVLRTTTLATSIAAALVLTACGGGGTAPSAPQATATAAPADSPLNLAGACPATVVVQEDWQPEAEHGSAYSLVGPDRTIDTNAKKVRGSLVAQGVDTGVDIEVRTGGPNVGFQPVPALMKLDESITLGTVYSDVAISSSDDQPVVGVVAQLTTSPVILMWDPASHPGATTVKDVAASGVPVLTSDPVVSALLESKGIVAKAQVDASYDGSPARFVADPKILQQGYITSEPYLYENEIAQWKKPVASQKLVDLGYTVYPSSLSVRADKLEQLRPCLAKLVPILQRAQLDYLANPAPTNALIVQLVEAYQTGWSYSPGVADNAVKVLRDQKLVTNDPASGVFGQFDPARVQQIVSTFAPILQAQGAIKDVPAPQTLYTNDFIDKNIKMS